MANQLKRFFRFRTLLVAFSFVSIISLLLSYLSVYVSPGTLRYLPLFGLGYWVILTGHLLLLAIWIFIRPVNKWLWVMIGVVLIGGRLHFRTFSIGWDDSNDAKKTELKLVSYNVRLFDLYNPSYDQGQKNRSEIYRYLVNQNADIYCLQEFYNQEPPSKYYTKDTLRKLLKTPYLHTRLSRTDYKKQEFGVAIFSKYEIIQKGEVSFDDVERTYNYCVYADIVKNADTFRVYNVHLQSIHLQRDDYALFNEDNKQSAEQKSQAAKLITKLLDAFPVRAEQAKKLMAHMKLSPHPIIVCGDFNDSPMSYAYNQFNRFLTDAYRNTSFGMGTTYAGKVPAGRIDYIFHDESMGSRNFAIQKEKLSDHYAISCSVFKQ